MPKTKKVILLLRERREIWRVRFGKRPNLLCEQCRRETVWLTIAEAALISGFSEREIFCFTEIGTIEFKESITGALLICSGSLEYFCLTRKI